jgi:hypothetical protein
MTVSGVGETTVASHCASRRSGAGSTDFAAALATARRSAPTAGVSSPLLAARLILPTQENVEQLASELAQKLSSRFAAAGIAGEPAISITVDAGGGIHIAGARGDVGKIESLVSADPALQRSIRNVNAIASHAYDLENGGQLTFQRAYRLSADPHEVVAQYANLIGAPHSARVSLAFSGGNVSIVAGGAN